MFYIMYLKPIYYVCLIKSFPYRYTSTGSNEIMNINRFQYCLTKRLLPLII